MTKFKHRAEIRNGEIFMSNSHLWEEEKNSIGNGAVFLTIERDTGEVTIGQHKYYRGVLLANVLKIEEFGGWDKEELHTYLKDELKVEKSTAHMSSTEMSEFIEGAKNLLAVKHSIVIPEIENYHD